MYQLNILAVQNAPLLRALATDPNTAKAELATAVGKDRSNLNRSIAALAEAGLLAGTDDGERGLTDRGREQLAAIDRAEGRGGEPGSSDGLPPDHVLAIHAQLIPDPGNARKDWDSAEAVADLAELAESINQSGLLQNPMVKVAPVEFQTPDQPLTYMLDGGERRWRAIGRLIADGRWPAERAILCRLIETDDLGHRLAALAENMQRRNLNPLEKAKAFDGLAESLAAQGVAPDKINREIADRVGVTIEHVQQHRAFLKLDDEDQQRLTLPKDDPQRMTVREARQRVSIKSDAEAKVAAVNVELVRVRLAAVELIAKVLAEGAYTYSDVPVRPDASETETGARLKELGWVTFSASVMQWGKHKGFFTASRAHQMPHQLLATYATKPEVEARLDELYAEAGLTRGAAPATDWLAEGEMPEAGKELIERDKQREQSVAAQRERDEAERTAEKARYAEARQKHLALLNAAAETPLADVASATVEAAAAIENPLPWTLLDDGDVIDANGEEVSRFGGYYGGASDDEMIFLQMVVLSVNSAAGLPTPPIKSADKHREKLETAEEARLQAEADAVNADDVAGTEDA